METFYIEDKSLRAKKSNKINTPCFSSYFSELIESHLVRNLLNVILNVAKLRQVTSDPFITFS